MAKVSFRIAYYIIVAGLFVIVSFIALNYERLDYNFYIIISFLTIFIFLFGFASGQNFSSPIKKLLERVNVLISGDIKSRVYLKENDEFGQLANSLNRVAEEFELIHRNSETSKRSDDIKLKTRILILEEVINALEKKVKGRTLELERAIDNQERLQKELEDMAIETSSLKEKKSRVKKLKVEI